MQSFIYQVIKTRREAYHSYPSIVFNSFNPQKAIKFALDEITKKAFSDDILSLKEFHYVEGITLSQSEARQHHFYEFDEYTITKAPVDEELSRKNTTLIWQLTLLEVKEIFTNKITESYQKAGISISDEDIELLFDNMLKKPSSFEEQMSNFKNDPIDADAESPENLEYTHWYDLYEKK